MAAVLRGALVCTGDVELLLAIQRIFPGPPRAGSRRPGAVIAMSGEQVKILDGNTFVVSDDRGDIEASLTDPTGLFSFDTRFLSKWILSVNGQRLTALSVDDLQYFETQFFLVPGTGTVYVDSKLSVIRHRTVGNGFQEQLTFLNHEHEPVDLVVRIDADCDFADLFEVKDAAAEEGHVRRSGSTSRRWSLAYQRETFSRATMISSSEPCAFDENGLTFEIRIDPHAIVDDRRSTSRSISVSTATTPSDASELGVAVATPAHEHGPRSGAMGRRTRHGSSPTGSR